MLRQHQNQPTTAPHRGRKPADLSLVIGTTINSLTALGVADELIPVPGKPKRRRKPGAKTTAPSRHVHLLCRCDCGQLSTPRLSDFKRGHTGSCSCQGKANYLNYWEGRAQNIHPSLCRKIALASLRQKLSPWRIVAKFKIAKDLIGACVRLHLARLKEKFGLAFFQDPYLRPALPLHLHRAEAGWLRKTIRRMRDCLMPRDESPIRVDLDEMTPEDAQTWLELVAESKAAEARLQMYFATA